MFDLGSKIYDQGRRNDRRARGQAFIKGHLKNNSQLPKFYCHIVSNFCRYHENRLTFGIRNFFTSFKNVVKNKAVQSEFHMHLFDNYKQQCQGHFYEKGTLAPLRPSYQKAIGAIGPRAPSPASLSDNYKQQCQGHFYEKGTLAPLCPSYQKATGAVGPRAPSPASLSMTRPKQQKWISKLSSFIILIAV